MQRICPRCGASVSDTVKFCTMCGAKMERSCPKCGRPLALDAKFCVFCGFQLSPSAAVRGQQGSTTQLKAPQSPVHPGATPSSSAFQAGKQVKESSGEATVEIRHDVVSDRNIQPGSMYFSNDSLSQMSPDAEDLSTTRSGIPVNKSNQNSKSGKDSHVPVVPIVIVVCLVLIAGIGSFFAWRGIRSSSTGGTPSSTASKSNDLSSSASTSSSISSEDSSNTQGSVSSSTGYTFGDEQPVPGSPAVSGTITVVYPSMEIQTKYSSILQLYVMAASEFWDPARMIMQNLNSQCSGMGLDDLGYAFVELTADQSPELLIGDARGGHSSTVYSLYTIRNDSPFLIAQSTDIDSYSVCADGTLCSETKDTSGTRSAFYKVTSDGNLEFVEAVVYDTTYSSDSPWLYTTTQPVNGPYVQIAQTEASAILQKHGGVTIPYTQLRNAVGMTGTSTQNPAQVPFPTQNDYLLPTDSRYIDESELYGLSKDQTSLILNEIYARHGCTFQKDAYRNYFASKSWYQPIDGLTASNFDGSVFNDFERKNIDTIVLYQESMGWRN